MDPVPELSRLFQIWMTTIRSILAILLQHRLFVRFNFFLFLKDSFRESCSKFINSAFIQNEQQVYHRNYSIFIKILSDVCPRAYSFHLPRFKSRYYYQLSHMVHRKSNGFQIKTRQRFAAHMWFMHWTFSDRNSAVTRKTHMWLIDR